MLEASIALCFFVFFVFLTIWVVMDYRDRERLEKAQDFLKRKRELAERERLRKKKEEEEEERLRNWSGF